MSIRSDIWPPYAGRQQPSCRDRGRRAVSAKSPKSLGGPRLGRPRGGETPDKTYRQVLPRRPSKLVAEGTGGETPGGGDLLKVASVSAPHPHRTTTVTARRAHLVTFRPVLRTRGASGSSPCPDPLPTRRRSAHRASA